jgi:NADH:ubiquinone oxidoreductase subunit 5 (subunit L)/multisubunit Na+/H+ antiporter MnhA subunit
MEAATVDILPLIHLIVLSLWGGVVATEAVIEIYPFRHSEMHAATIRLHYWIDLLVEAPLVAAVVVTGAWLLFQTDPVTPLHLVKVAFAGTAVVVDIFCIAVVVRRGRRLDRCGEDGQLWRASRIVLACFAVGLACAGVAATLGFTLALARIG